MTTIQRHFAGNPHHHHFNSGDSMASMISPPVYYGFFPFNQSLEDEFNRLFVNFTCSYAPIQQQNDQVMDEFRSNGKDYEYCPDPNPEEVVVTQIKRKNKKPLPTECVFCKNNGEDPKVYKNHLLKDQDGKTICPILRRYICPICQATGEKAHTLKYCPANKQTQPIVSMNALKTMRNSTGRRRSK